MPARGGSPSPVAPASDRWPFVGRHLDLDLARSAITDGERAGVLVAGGPGLGKTRLAEELLAELRDDGYRVATALASTTAATVPLGALAHLLPPEVVLADSDTGPLDPVRLLARARQALTEDQGSLVVMVDDGHLLDATSLTLLTQLVHDGAARLVVTIRTGELLPDGLTALWRSERLYRVDLDPLGPDAMDTLLHMALGGPVDGRTAFALREASGGNPLLLRELVRTAIAERSLRRVEGVWALDGGLPRTPRIAELLGARLRSVDGVARDVLEVLALAGPTRLDLLLDMADLRVLEQLEADELVELRPGDGAPDVVALAHPVLADAVTADIPALRTRSILAAHADRVEASPDGQPDDVLRIASWRLEAGLAVDPDLLETATLLACYANDYPATARLARALNRVAPTMRSAVIEGEALYELGRWEEADEVLAGADALEGTAADHLSLVAMRSTNTLFGLLRPDDAIALTQAALAAVDAGELVATRGVGPEELDLIRAELVSRVANVQMYGGDPAAALATLGPAPAGEVAPPPSGAELDPVPRATVRGRVLWAIPGAPATALAGRTADAVALANRAYEEQGWLGGDVAFSSREVHLLTLCLALQEHGSLAEARGLAEVGHRESIKMAMPLGVTWFALNLGRIALLQGHAATGVRWFREALAVTATTGWLGPRMLALSGLGAMSAALGDLTTAEQSIAAYESFPGRFGFLLPEQCAGSVWLAIAQGRTGDAREELRTSAELAGRTGHLTVEAWLRHDAARLGRPADELPRLQELAAASQSPLVAARAAHVAAEVEGDPDALEAAGDALASFGVDLAAAEAVASAADAARARGDQRLANRLAGRAHDLLQRCEGVRSHRVVPAETVVPLTAREREIATLAASGLQSKDIADRLYLSVRTVNNHLQNAYTKLGVSSRAELTKVLGREGGPTVG